MGHKHRISVLLSPAFMSEMAPISTEFCEPQRKSLSAINRHNQHLFDHLGGAQQNRWGYREAERLGGLEVHGHLKFCRQLNGQLRRLCAAQNAIRVRGGTTPGICLVDSVRE